LQLILRKRQSGKVMWKAMKVENIISKLLIYNALKRNSDLGIFISLQILFLIFAISSTNSLGQNYVQDVRGIVTEAHTGVPLPGATVLITTGAEPKGITTDANGRFHLPNVEVGRHSIRITYIGFKPYEINNLSISTGKEVFLEIKLEESTLLLETVEFKYEAQKENTINEMALVSARMFTVEETERYAGSIGDPARMASNFAGVGSLNDQSNSIVIRGNSPFGMLWMLDGIDIPNPSHFGAMGGTGGAISMLNNNTLTNSDFLTGAFPAQYGNALSGVFDLKLRNGNSQKYEFLGQIAFNGFEAGVEGPISRKNNTSFLVSYRYSTLAVLDKVIGLEKLALSAVPYYQDFSFKALVYRGKLGRISLFALGGKNNISMEEENMNPDEWNHSLIGQNMRMDAASAVGGISHTINPGTTTKLETTLAYTHSSYGFWSDTLTRQALEPFPQHRHADSENSLALSSLFTWKRDASNILSAGIYVQPMQFSFIDSAYQRSSDSFRTTSNFSGTYTLSKLHTQWKHNFNDNTSLVAGVHAMHFTSNNDLSVEPRLAFRWGFRPNQAIGFATGLHSNLAPRLFYVYEQSDGPGNAIQTNKNLKFTRSLHFIAGYDILLPRETRLKLETYFQHHYNVPVSEEIPGWSLLNYGSDWVDWIKPMGKLINEGSGQNYGLELTLEKFLSKGFYYLLTGSLYDATYKGFDQKQRNSVFNGNFILNALAGKEFTIRGRNVLSFDAKVVWSGSKRYLPFSSYQVSENHHVRVDDWENAYTSRMKDFLRINLRIGYRINLYNATHELAVDIYNLTNRKNIFLEFFDTYTGETETMYQFPFFPVLLYRVQF
jgi:hypothetical protein